jgi:hypothetical protein
MRFRIITLISFLFVSSLNAQKAKYDALILKALELLEEGAYEQSLQSYEQALKLHQYATNIDIYNAACVAAKSSNVEKSFALLMQSIQRGFWDYNHLDQDEDWTFLQDDPRWLQCRNQILIEVNKELKPYLTKIPAYQDSLATYLIRFKENDLYGYLDQRTCQTVVKPIFGNLGFMNKQAEIFYKNTPFFLGNDGIIRFGDVVSNPVNPNSIHSLSACRSEQLSQLFSDYYCFKIKEKAVIVATNTHNLKGLVDEKGQILLNLDFRFTWLWGYQKDIGTYFHFQEGQKQGIIDDKGVYQTFTDFKIASVPIEFYDMFTINPIQIGATFFPIEKDGKLGIVEITSLSPLKYQVIVPIEYDNCGAKGFTSDRNPDVFYFEMCYNGQSVLVDKRNKRYLPIKNQ